LSKTFDLRSLTRGVSLIALYELDTTTHDIQEMVTFRAQPEAQENARFLAYLGLRWRLAHQSDVGPSQAIDLHLSKAFEQRSPIEQVLIDVITEGHGTEDITEDMQALIEHEVLIPNIEEFDLRLELESDRLPLEYQKQMVRLTRGVWQYRTYLDELIHRFAPDYPVDQISVIDRNILRLSLYEFGILAETPVSVAISEAIELAKVFGSESSLRFVNGVLSALVKAAQEDRSLFHIPEFSEPV
jgi:transcription antitermination protein NusB